MEDSRLKQLFDFHENDPKDPFPLFAIAKEYENLNQLDQALSWYLKLKKEHPEYIGLFYHLGKLYELIQEDILALEAYKEGIKLASEIKDFHALSELNNAKLNLEMTLGN